MTDTKFQMTLGRRLFFYLAGIVFATFTYIAGLWAYGMESASWGNAEIYKTLVANLRDGFESHQLTFFVWEVVCTAISFAMGYILDREVYYRRKAEQQANIDGLTGIYNHRYFQERLNSEVERAGRYGRHLSLLILDVDNFKVFNDTWGHQEGDKLLVLFVGVCQKCIRSMDMLARYGGEEFVVILPETDSEAALVIAERIREAVEKQTAATFGKNKGATVSAGVASFPQHGATRHSLILNSDAALYYAKQRGKNQSCVYDEDCHRSYRATSNHIKPGDLRRHGCAGGSWRHGGCKGQPYTGAFPGCYAIFGPALRGAGNVSRRDRQSPRSSASSRHRQDRHPPGNP